MSKFKRWMGAGFILATLFQSSMIAEARSVTHLAYQDQVYSATASGDVKEPFNVYLDGEFIGQFTTKRVIDAGFNEAELVEVLTDYQLNKPESERKSELEFTDSNDQASYHADVSRGTSPKEAIKGSHSDVVYPGDKFSEVGAISPFENYNGHHEDFLRLLSDYAYLAREKGLLPSVMIGQAMLESGEDGGSGLALGNKNIFGIKGEYNGNGTNWDTLEDYGGMVQVNDQFRLYPTYKESVMDYIRLITETERYQSVVTYDTPEGQVEAIRNSGYATDSNYVSKVLNIIDKHDLRRFDF